MTHIQTMIRVINAWDSTTLPKNKDGRLWQMIEEMRQALEEALANHIPDDTKMVSGVKDSLTTQQEQRKCNNCGEFGECCQKQEQGEPVARIEITYHRGQLESWRFSERPTNAPEGTYDVYTTPQQRKPLTDEQLHELWFKQSVDWMEFAKAIEAAHGIKENT